MFGFRRNKATGGPQRQGSQDLLMTADIDARLPIRPTLDGYRVEEVSFDSVVQLFRKDGEHRDHVRQLHRANLRASEAEPGKLLTPK